MANISKKQHLLLIVTAILVLYSCNFIIGKNDIKVKKSEKAKQRVALDKEQAKILVTTSKTAIEVIDVCNTLEKAEIQMDKKIVIADVKMKQKEILRGIKTIAPSLMISVPSNINESITEGNIAFENLNTEINKINNKVFQQQQLVKKLNSKTKNDLVFDLTEEILPIIDYNIEKLNLLTTLE